MCLVAITYVYFLIFAQFAFLKRLAELGIRDSHLKTIMAVMAAGGILFSLLAPRVHRWSSPELRLRVAFGICGVTALIATRQLGVAGASVVAGFIGAGVGLLTVTLVTHLRRWTGSANPFFIVGAGTGLGYFLCNVPPFFAAAAQVQALIAAALCLIAVVTLIPSGQEEQIASPVVSAPVWLVIAGFTALVWLDSAAFYIIQNAPALKAQTWNGSGHLWLNAGLHLAAALGSAWLLSRRGLRPVLVLAVVVLGSACLLLGSATTAPIASVFYPIGVSLYSVALVAYPSLIAVAATTAERGRIAGWLYAIAGWIGSAMGIGMGQNLAHVPAVFVFAAALVVIVPFSAPLFAARRRELTLTALVAAAAGLLQLAIAHERTPEQLSPVERGRQVYISEGCIHCHSQYVRPGTTDVAMWGPVRSLADLREDRPPLIGNRRQGPDLSQVGVRRSALWLKMHFFNPAAVSGASIMPTYGFLFRDQRGNDLVAYLLSLRGPDAEAHIAGENTWQPDAHAIAGANESDGEKLYARDCATCHTIHGATRTQWLPAFAKVPSDLTTMPSLELRAGMDPRQQVLALARITKFGIAGTDMAGHEYLSDQDVLSIALWLSHHVASAATRR